MVISPAVGAGGDDDKKDEPKENAGGDDDKKNATDDDKKNENGPTAGGDDDKKNGTKEKGPKEKGKGDDEESGSSSYTTDSGSDSSDSEASLNASAICLLGIVFTVVSALVVVFISSFIGIAWVVVKEEVKNVIPLEFPELPGVTMPPILSNLNSPGPISLNNYFETGGDNTGNGGSDSVSGPIPTIPTLSPEGPMANCETKPGTLSGNFWIQNSVGSPVLVHCDTSLSCGGVIGGWIRVTNLDMTNSNHRCPSPFIERNDVDNITRSCVRNNESAGCSSVKLFTGSIQYSQVCGKIIGYQIGRPNQFRYERRDGVRGFKIREFTDIDNAYVDGVSITHGLPPMREHIWSFAAAKDEGQTCLCDNIYFGDSPPKFVGQDYFCEAGRVSEAHGIEKTVFFQDPLWDGTGCTNGRNTCCSFNNPPWFYKKLPLPITDDLELRLCRDQVNNYEDVGIKSIDIYIQ